MERKLASLQLIDSINSIDGADKIELAIIKGWECVVKKGEFHKGDRCVYFEVDSILPRKSWNEFLFRDDKKEVRLKTVRMKGQISQGLALPLDLVLDAEGYSFKLGGIIDKERNIVADPYEGTDLTELLDITKYVPYISANLQGDVKGKRPEFVPKTDEERIQNYPELLEDHKGKIFYVTEKIDGSSMSVYFKDGEFGVCSRNMDLKEKEGNGYWKAALYLELRSKMKNYGKNLVFQGELWGNGIQGNKLKIDETKFSVFNVYDIDSRKFLDIHSMIELCMTFGVDTVPVLELHLPLNHTVKDLVKLATGKSVINKKIQREGIVLRPLEEERDSRIGRLSFKAINPKFLLKYGE